MSNGDRPPGEGSPGQDPFELEPEKEGPKHEPALPIVEDEPELAGAGSAGTGPAGTGPAGVDDRTLAERLGKQVRPRGAAEPVPNPDGWPREALTFPFRRPGPGFLILSGGGLLVLDALGTVEALRFPGWVLKLFLLMFLLRAWLHVIATTAAGRDEPVGWTAALEFDWDELWRYGRTLALLFVVFVPGLLVWQFGRGGLGLTLLLAGSLYASVVSLGAALRDPALKYPWHALRWIATRPLHCLLGGVGWWLLVGTELVLAELLDESRFVQLGAALGLRSLLVVALLVTARILGVMGRRWTVD